jgi:hypothetical protein
MIVVALEITQLSSGKLLTQGRQRNKGEVYYCVLNKLGTLCKFQCTQRLKGITVIPKQQTQILLAMLLKDAFLSERVHCKCALTRVPVVDDKGKE